MRCFCVTQTLEAVIKLRLVLRRHPLLTPAATRRGTDPPEAQGAQHSVLRTASVLVLLVIAATAAAQGEPSAQALVQRMKAALEPARASTRTITLTVSGTSDSSSQSVARQARKQLADGNRSVTVMISPEGVRGTALLVLEPANGPATEWVYTPAVRRVRKIVPIGAFEAFLDSDFTYGDLGFVNLHDRTFTLLGSDSSKGAPAYKVQEGIGSPWYYSQVIDWIATDTGLPLERDFFDTAKQLWKVERFDRMSVIDGVPTAQRIRMEDVQQGGSSELQISELHYDAVVPDDVFDPAMLPQLLKTNSPLWTGR